MNFCISCVALHKVVSLGNDQQMKPGLAAGCLVTIWVFVTVRHGKIHPFLRTVNLGKPSINLWAIEKPWRNVSHNQRVNSFEHITTLW